MFHLFNINFVRDSVTESEVLQIQQEYHLILIRWMKIDFYKFLFWIGVFVSEKWRHFYENIVLFFELFGVFS